MAYSSEETTSSVEVLGSILLFCLVFGMAATVEIECLRAQLGNVRAIVTGLLLQFVVMPFLGFIVVHALRLDYEVGLILLVITSSPGGSYSNWFCSLFNGDLALSGKSSWSSTFCRRRPYCSSLFSCILLKSP
jgi:predicted Na+-dependent transporter